MLTFIYKLSKLIFSNIWWLLPEVVGSMVWLNSIFDFKDIFWKKDTMKDKNSIEYN